jgi:hypothetical protein
MLEPYLYEVGDTIVFKVVAYNSISNGPESGLSNEALIDIIVVPDQPIDL